jgi:hypothetical protein
METNRRSFFRIAGAAGAGMLAAGKSSAKDEASLPSGSQLDEHQTTFTKELFLDNEMLEVTPGVSRKLHPPKKHPLNPVVRCERWCDGEYIQPYTTMYDEEDKLFKMWARAGSDWKLGRVADNAAYMLYFTSTDGVHWDKPDLGVMDVAGRRDHNIIFTSDMVLSSVAPLPYGPEKYVVPSKPMEPQGKKAFFWAVNKHPHPRDASEKFIGLAIVQDHRRGAHIVTSPDGIHWACASSPFWQTPHDVAGTGDDCLMHVMFDDAKQKWSLYRRVVPEFSEHLIADESDRNRPREDRYYRSYAYAESDDLHKWKNHQFILAMDPDDPPDTELYQFACHKYGDIYVGYVSVFYLRRPQPIDVHLATSRDGIHFTRVCRGQPFNPHGQLGYYDYMAMGCSQPKPLVVNDTAYYYYAALNYPHDANQAQYGPGELTGGAALATFKRDRFVSLETSKLDRGPCRVITKPFTVHHSKLYLNAATWEKGSIRVEALTRDWQPIPGYTEPQAREIQGDALDHPVRWKNAADLSKLLGKEIRLKCHMTRARIHAMTWSNDDRPLRPVETEYRHDERGDASPQAT